LSPISANPTANANVCGGRIHAAIASGRASSGWRNTSTASGVASSQVTSAIVVLASVVQPNPSSSTRRAARPCPIASSAAMWRDIARSSPIRATVEHKFTQVRHRKNRPESVPPMSRAASM